MYIYTYIYTYYIYIYIFFFLLSLSLSTFYQSIYPSIRLSLISLSLYLFISLSLYLFISLSLSLSTYIYIYIPLSVYLSLSLALSLSLSFSHYLFCAWAPPLYNSGCTFQEIGSLTSVLLPSIQNRSRIRSHPSKWRSLTAINSLNLSQLRTTHNCSNKHIQKVVLSFINIHQKGIVDGFSMCFTMFFQVEWP